MEKNTIYIAEADNHNKCTIPCQIAVPHFLKGRSSQHNLFRMGFKNIKWCTSFIGKLCLADLMKQICQVCGAAL